MSRPRHAVTAKQSLPRSVRTAVGWVFTADRGAATRQALGQVISALSAVALVLASALLFRTLLRGNDYSTATVLGPVFAFALIGGATSLIAAVSAQRQRLLAEKVEQELWRRIISVVSRTPLITYERDGFVTRLAQIHQNAVTRPLQTVRAVFTLLGSVLTALALGAALVSFSVYLPLILLAAGAPAVLVGRAASRSEYAFSRTVIPLYMRRDYLRRVLVERRHAAELRSFEALSGLGRRHGELAGAMESRLRIHVRRRAWQAAAGSAVTTVGLLAALAAIVLLVDNGHLSLADAGAAAIAARLFGNALTGAYAALASVVEAAPHLVDLQDFLSVDRSPHGAPYENGHEAQPLRRRVRLIGVSFRYPNASRPALENVTFEIARGEVVAVVGENGSGKTTLARIVAGLYEPDDGDVQWDDAASHLDDRRASTSMLAQDFGQYAMTVTDNIALGRQDVTSDAVIPAALSAHFDGEVARLPAGYDTVLGRELDEGVDLSGGQWQRLGLARALFAARDLLVLDEPSAALDPRSESELFDDVRTVLSGRSALLISHRFASARLADRIYVLHQGVVVEQGTHTELMLQRGRYAELFELQSAAYLSGLVGGET